MLLGADHPFRFFRVHVGLVEQAHLEFPQQHRRNELVELRFLQGPLTYQFGQVQIAVRLRQLDIDSGGNRQPAGVLLLRATA